MEKQILKNSNRCTVTFSLPREVAGDAKEVLLLGDFNNWDFEHPIVLHHKKDGSFAAKVKLEGGRDYHFRYLIDHERWENDRQADRYEASPAYTDVSNSVVSLREELEIGVLEDGMSGL